MKLTLANLQRTLCLTALALLITAATAAGSNGRARTGPVVFGTKQASCNSGGGVHCDAFQLTGRNGRALRFATHHEGARALALAGQTAYSPAQLHAAYQLPWYSGVQQTIALVVAYHHPYIKYDLDQYDASYNLGSFPTCSATVTTACFDVVSQYGTHTNYPAAITPATNNWDLEADMDVETAHEICLNCKILLVETNGNLPDMAAGENAAAALGATEISNSYSQLESKLSGTDWASRSAWNHKGIAIVASAGDNNYGTGFPADLNTVVAVGGTNLYLNSSGGYGYETTWGLQNGEGTGSGCSLFNDSYTSVAYWQSAVANWAATGCGTRRGISDVAADASCSTGTWIYTTQSATRSSTWQVGCGTSLSSPIIAGVYALAGNAYTVSWAAQLPYQHSQYLNDVSSGYNGSCGTLMCQAVTGYDGPTGLGTPRGINAF